MTYRPESPSKWVPEDYSSYTYNPISPKRSLLPAEKIANTIRSYLKTMYMVDAVAGTGEATKVFVNSFQKVIGYESNREKWMKLHRNIAAQCDVYNQEFNIGEDVQLLNIDDKYVNGRTAVYFHPEWNHPGKSMDKSNYYKSGIKVSNQSLEWWCKHLVDIQKFELVILKVPPGYDLIVEEQYIDDSNPEFRLIYYTLRDITQMEKDGVVTFVQRDVKGAPEEDSKPVLSFEKELDNIPGPLEVKGPKVILQTYLTQDFPQKQYRKEYFNPKAISLPQRRTLLSEIEFLLRVLKTVKTEHTVVYVGNGDHLFTLVEMFPEITIDLYTTSKPSQTHKRIRYQRKSLENNIKNYALTPHLLFISNDTEEKNIPVMLDLQKTRLEQLKPSRSLLLFKLPYEYTEDWWSTDYLDGIINFQAYSAPQSTETRLEVGPRPDTITFEHEKYEQQLFYFNTQYRIQSFRHYNRRYGWSYDTIREFFILKKYLGFRGAGDKQLPEYVKLFDIFDKINITKIVEKY